MNSGAARAPRLVYLATDPITAFRLMDGQLAAMRQRGFDVSVVTAPGKLLEQVAAREEVSAFAVPMNRDISPLHDVVSLFRLVRLFRNLRPDLVNAGTPKAGLLGVIAGRLAGVPIVVYLMRGLRMEGAVGFRRLLLTATEHVAGALAHRVFCNSSSLRERFISLGCAAREQTFVPGEGTSNGVDLARFEVDDSRRDWAARERARRGIGATAIVIGFVGRFTRDKGIADLVVAFATLQRGGADVSLLLVGDYDATDPVDKATRAAIAANSNISVTGFIPDPSAEYALMDILAFPSCREGFPNVPLEAAAAALPCVAFRATGTVDAVVDGETGTTVPIGDVQGFASALGGYVADADLRLRHGEAAKHRVTKLFRREVVWDALAQEYERLLAGSRASSE